MSYITLLFWVLVYELKPRSNIHAIAVKVPLWTHGRLPCSLKVLSNQNYTYLPYLDLSALWKIRNTDFECKMLITFLVVLLGSHPSQNKPLYPSYTYFKDYTYYQAYWYAVFWRCRVTSDFLIWASIIGSLELLKMLQLPAIGLDAKGITFLLSCVLGWVAVLLTVWLLKWLRARRICWRASLHPQGTGFWDTYHTWLLLITTKICFGGPMSWGMSTMSGSYGSM